MENLMENKQKYVVIVANVGDVYRGTNEEEANKAFDRLVQKSKNLEGIVAGEDVFLFSMLREYTNKELSN